MNRDSGSRSDRLSSIDALRGAAAMGVVMFHVVGQTANLPNSIFKYPIRALEFLSSFGYIGVFLFFVISGFCIHLQWARRRAEGEQTNIQFGAFWKRRLRRLYPPYIIALALYVSLTAITVGVPFTRFFFYDLGVHVLMLHNLDPNTCYTINGVFWTLAIEEQLYLAYFLLLFLRRRFNWSTILLLCLLVRAGWMLFSHEVWVLFGKGVPVPEAAAVHWFTWVLGAIAVEAMFGLTTLPAWTRSLSLSVLLIVAASAFSYLLPWIPKDTLLHNATWFVIHPLWGVGFFLLINRAVKAEKGWLEKLKFPSVISVFATLGIFSYSIYLTHELVIMQSWRFISYSLSSFQNLFLIVLPAVVLFAWVFFWFCERPFMRKRAPARLSITGKSPALAGGLDAIEKLEPESV